VSNWSFGRLTTQPGRIASLPPAGREHIVSAHGHRRLRGGRGSGSRSPLPPGQEPEDPYGVGNVLFKVADIYTATIDSQGKIIQGLKDAKIKVEHEVHAGIQVTKATDDLGEAFFTNLREGRYRCRITAPGHNSYSGRFWIKPGITATQSVFLTSDLVTVEWEVVESTIEDRYDVVLTLTYETDVPAAVVVAEPPSVTLRP